MDVRVWDLKLISNFKTIPWLGFEIEVERIIGLTKNQSTFLDTFGFHKNFRVQLKSTTKNAYR